jgi:S-DNA-T family DNA segregation ATPase FtsK/SpoIIIE
LALISHHPGDTAWTTSGAGAVTRNAAGRLGALISDIGFFLLGFSIWWSYGAALSVWVRALLQRLRSEDAPVADVPWRHTKWAFWSGLAMLLLSSAALEWSRLYRFEDQLAGSISGGVVGYFIGPVSEHWLGFNGAGLVFIALMLVGASWVFRFSWVQVAQDIGAAIDGFVASWREKRELAQDLALGQAAARERD